MKFKDFIYYVMLVVVAGLFLVLAFSYFAPKDNESGSEGSSNRVSVDLASGVVFSNVAPKSYDIPDIIIYDFLDIYYYSTDGSGFFQIVVSDIFDNPSFTFGSYFSTSLPLVSQDFDIGMFVFSFDRETHTFIVSLKVITLSLEPVDTGIHFYLKGVNYV